MSWSCNKREHPLYIPGPTQTDTIQAQDSPEKDSFEAKKAELVGLGIANELKEAQKGLTEEQMKATAEMVKQKWQEVNIKQGHLDLDKFIQDVKESTKLTTQAIIRVIGLLR